VETSEKKPLQTVGWWQYPSLLLVFLGSLLGKFGKLSNIIYATMGEHHRVEGDLASVEVGRTSLNPLHTLD